MRKYMGYIPPIIFSVIFLVSRLTVSGFASAPHILWLACFFLSAILMHKGIIWGGIPGLFPAIHMIVMGISQPEKALNIEIIIGIALILFYISFGLHLWKRRNTEEPEIPTKEIIGVFLKIILSAISGFLSIYAAFIIGLMLFSEGINSVIATLGMLVAPSLLFPLIWLKKRKKFIIVWIISAFVYAALLGVNYGIILHDRSITVNTSPNINIHEYLPFEENSKIVKYESKTLKLTDKLPKIDGAAALFPVYSAFVNSVYPEGTEIHSEAFQYNNTPMGYQKLARKETDIFIGVYPSDEQKAYAEECNTTFQYTPIGTEAFVFFVHKDNPIENLTADQIRKIYSGEITNWSEVGGRDEEIAAFQRNQGSGSQSMLERFMGDTPIMEAPKEMVNDLMAGIIEKVSDYRSKPGSIGFSFRYYVEGIIKNPDIKMISIDGIAPTAENIRNGKYSVVTPIYAVTYKEQTNENVKKLLSWILSDEGQYIIEETGYVGIGKETP